MTSTSNTIGDYLRYLERINRTIEGLLKIRDRADDDEFALITDAIQFIELYVEQLKKLKVED